MLKEQIIYDLNIMKEHKLEVQAQKSGPRAFFTSLPQTQDELDQLSIDSADYQIKEFVHDIKAD